MNWYLVQTKPNAHFLASKNLMLQNFEVFLPLYQRLKSWEGFLTTRYHYFQVIYSLAPIQIKSPGKVSIRPGECQR